MPVFKRLLLCLFMLCCGLPLAHAAGGGHGGEPSNFPLSEEAYAEMESKEAEALGHELTLMETLQLRAKADPFNVFATVIFLLAVAHTFVAAKFNKMAHDYEHAHKESIKNHDYVYVDGKEPVSLRATLFHFLGEVEAIFGIWLVPLLIGMIFFKADAGGSLLDGWHSVTDYIDGRNYTEPMFVVIIMAIASSRPVIQIAESCLKLVAGIGKQSPAAWWFSILIIGPLLGSFITEPAAMTIAAMLLGQRFYALEPSNKFKYATLGLLFVNISVGGTLTHFAAPPVLMVASKWGFDMSFMFLHFGDRAVLGIVVSTLLFYFFFKKEFAALAEKARQRAARAGDESKPEPAPKWIVGVHLGFVAWTVLTLHHPAMFVGGFLFFIAFTMATHHHQYDIKLKGPLLVGFFLAGLVTHGGLQGWWIAPVLSSLTEVPLFIGATILTAFNDNAAITYLASQVPAFYQLDLHGAMKTGEALEVARSLQFAVVAGAVTGGGLTVIANAPNPAGQSILSKHFGGAISPLGLFLGACIPTIIMAICFMVIPH